VSVRVGAYVSSWEESAACGRASTDVLRARGGGLRAKVGSEHNGRHHAILEELHCQTDRLLPAPRPPCLIATKQIFRKLFYCCRSGWLFLEVRFVPLLGRPSERQPPESPRFLGTNCAPGRFHNKQNSRFLQILQSQALTVGGDQLFCGTVVFRKEQNLKIPMACLTKLGFACLETRPARNYISGKAADRRLKGPYVIRLRVRPTRRERFAR
jgi:hypothetical protein